MPATDLALLIDAANAAGEIAKRFATDGARTWEKPDGTGPVTEADLAVNEMLSDRLRAARPDYGWLSEETEDDADRLTRDRVFIVDPIDGTRSFVEGSNTWAHSLAVAEAGEVRAAVVYLPMRDLLYTAALGHGAQVNGRPIGPSAVSEMSEAEILAARPVMEPRHWQPDAPPVFRRAYRPSLAYRMALVAEGKFDAMLTLRSCWEWDIAAGDLILREAGAQCTDRGGKPLRFNNAAPSQDGVIAAGGNLHRQLTGALRPAK